MYLWDLLGSWCICVVSGGRLVCCGRMVYLCGVWWKVGVCAVSWKVDVSVWYLLKAGVSVVSSGRLL